MAWARIDDGATNHPKIIKLIDWHNPFCVWVWGLSYCQLHLTDGLITCEAFPNKFALKTAEQLLTARLWEPHPAGFMVHDYLDWNDSRAVVLKKRQDAKDRMARKRSREQPATVRENVRANDPRTFSGELLRGVDLLNVPRKEDDPCSLEQSANVRTNSDHHVVLDASESLRWFDKVYAAYPNKDRKQPAVQAWVDLTPDLSLAQAILTNIEHRKRAGWVRFERRFIPQLVKFLTEKQWEDMAEAGPIYDEDDSGPHAWSCPTCGEIHEGSAAQHGRCLKATGDR